MKVLVELELNVSDRGDTSRDSIVTALEELLGAGDHGTSTQLLECRVTEVTPLLAATIQDKARTLLGRIAFQAMAEIPELRAVVCLPLWGLESKDLPLSTTFIRNDNKTDPLALKAALAAQLAIVLNQTVAVFPELVALAQGVVREAAQKAQHAHKEIGPIEAPSR